MLNQCVLIRSTDRNRLIALLRPYKNSPAKHEVWLRFQGYTRVIELGGGGGPAAKPAQP